jgi:dihydropteroate synthase
VAVELERVIPVVRALAAHGVVSIDTQKPEVARAAVAAGASIINDVSCTLVELAGELGVGYVAMHRLGPSRTMQDDPHYNDVVTDVAAALEHAATRARAAGVGELWLDPGIGFGKTVQHNLQLLAHLDVFVRLAARYDAGVLVGVSRKRFLGTLDAAPLEVADRLEGTIATEAWSILAGASIVRVHDVVEAVQLRDIVTVPTGGVTV